MSAYFDTSVLIAAVTEELRTQDARALLMTMMPDGFAVSSWTEAELSAALPMKVRAGGLAPQDLPKAFRALDALTGQGAWRIAVRDEDVVSAGALARAAATPLRAGDALHIAIARAHGLRLVTFDRDQAKAAQAHGLVAGAPG